MAPLHHHFEMLGWIEISIAQRFWIVNSLAGMLGMALALLQIWETWVPARTLCALTRCKEELR